MQCPVSPVDQLLYLLLRFVVLDIDSMKEVRSYGAGGQALGHADALAVLVRVVALVHDLPVNRLHAVVVVQQFNLAASQGVPGDDLPASRPSHMPLDGYHCKALLGMIPP